MQERWVDVFITKSANDQSTKPQATYNAQTQSYNSVKLEGAAYAYDDMFCCSVQSIQFDPNDPNTAYVVEADTPWILPTWTKEYQTSTVAKNPYSTIEVGDLVRVGGLHTAGFTDYLTVVEKRVVTHVANGTSSELRVSTGEGTVAGVDFIPQPTTTSTPADAGGLVTVNSAGIAHIALRLNAILNCTKLPTEAIDNNKTYPYHRQEVANATDVRATLATRHQAFQYLTNATEAYSGETLPSELYYYPLYVANRWSQNTTLHAKLDHGVKQVSAIKLIGYSFVNKPNVGIHHAHEMHADDFVILRIKEIEGHVISNNQYAHGAFAVLQAGKTSDNIIGATEFSRYDMEGLTCVNVESTNSTIRNLTIEVTDRMGKAARFGRFHLWFKLLVTHG